MKLHLCGYRDVLSQARVRCFSAVSVGGGRHTYEPNKLTGSSHSLLESSLYFDGSSLPGVNTCLFTPPLWKFTNQPMKMYKLAKLSTHTQAWDSNSTVSHVLVY